MGCGLLIVDLIPSVLFFLFFLNPTIKNLNFSILFDMKLLCFPQAVDFCKRVFKPSPSSSSTLKKPQPRPTTQTSKMATSTAAPSTSAASTAPSTKPTKPSKQLDDLLPAPPKENLTTNFILSEIISQIDLISDQFPLIDIPLLKSHLWDIANKNVDPKLHLRGFLKVFQKTKVFKEAYEELDDDMKKSLDVFLAGGGEKEVLAASEKGGKDGFVLPASPAVKNHFKDLREKIEEVLHHGHGHHEHVNGTTNGVVTNGLVKKVEEKVVESKELPRIFEDEKETRTMEVSHNRSYPKRQLSKWLLQTMK